MDNVVPVFLVLFLIILLTQFFLMRKQLLSIDEKLDQVITCLALENEEAQDEGVIQDFIKQRHEKYDERVQDLMRDVGSGETRQLSNADELHPDVKNIPHDQVNLTQSMPFHEVAE